MDGERTGSCETRAKGMSGFTLVELLLVVGLLGLLAVLLLPRVLERQVSPLDLTVRTVAGELEASAAVFHAQWIAHGRPAPDTPIVEFGGLRANRFGYPYGLDDNSRGLHGVATAEDCAAIFRLLLNSELGAGARDRAVVPSVRPLLVPEELWDSGADFAAVAALPRCRYYFTRDLAVASPSAGELLVLEYDPDRGRVSFERETASTIMERS